MRQSALTSAVAAVCLILLAGSPLAQPCEDLPFTDDRLGVLPCNGAAGDTVWAELYLETDSAVLGFVFYLQYDHDYLAPLRIAPGAFEVVGERVGRFPDGGNLITKISEFSLDSQAVSLIYFPEPGAVETPIPPGSGVICRVAFVVSQWLPPGDSARFHFLRYTRLTGVDSTVFPPDSQFICRSTSLALQYNDYVIDAHPRTDTTWFYYNDMGPTIDHVSINPRSLWQGEYATLYYETRFADSLVVEPDIGRLVAPSDFIRFTPAVSSDYTLTAWKQTGSVSRTLPVYVTPTGGNPPPWLAVWTTDTTIQTGEEVSLWIYAYDPDSTRPDVTFGPTLTGTNLQPTWLSEWHFTWTPTAGQVGSHSIWFYAADSLDPSLVDSQEVIVTVRDANQLPEYSFDTLIYTGVYTPEGSSAAITIRAWDNDGAPPYILGHLVGRDTVAENMTMIDSGNGIGVLTFSPDHWQGNDLPGEYPVSFTLYDAADPSVQVESNYKVFICQNVNTGLQMPRLQFSDSTGPFTVTETDTLLFDVLAPVTDTGDIPVVTASPLPPGGTLATPVGEELPNRKRFRLVPPFGSAGEYNLTFYADNAGLVDSETIAITVESGNRPPNLFLPPGQPNQAVEEDTLRFVVHAFDADSTVPAIGARLDGADTLAPNMTLVDSGNGTGVLTFVPNRLQGGNSCEEVRYYYVRFTATDVSPPHYTVTSSTQTIMIQDSGLPCCIDRTGDIDYNRNGHGNPNILDITWLIGYLLKGGPAPPFMMEADVDAQNGITMSDVTFLASHLFNGTLGPAICH